MVSKLNWPSTERHSLRRTLFLHLAPGALLTFAFILTAPAVNRTGGSNYLALLLCIPLILVPFEVGVLLLERRRTGLQLKAMIMPAGSSRVPILETLLSVVTLYAISQVAAILVAPSNRAILDIVIRWFPPLAIATGFPGDVSAATLWIGLLLSGLVAPIVEELYFRGFLMPRIPVAGTWRPAVNAALFSIYHFFSPWNYIAIFVVFLPLAYYVRLKGKLLPVIITHCLFNSVGIIVALVTLS